MTKSTNDPRLELEKLQKFFDAERAPLIEAIQDAERQEAEAKLAEDDAKRKARWSDADAHARHLLAVSTACDQLAKALALKLAERRNVSRDLARLAKDHPGGQFGGVFEHRRNINGMLTAAGVGDFCDFPARSNRALAEHDAGYLSHFDLTGAAA